MGVLEEGARSTVHETLRKAYQIFRRLARERRRLGRGGAASLLAGLAARPGRGRPVRGRRHLLAGRGGRRLHGPVGGASGQAGPSRPATVAAWRTAASGRSGGFTDASLPTACRTASAGSATRSTGWECGAREPGRHLSRRSSATGILRPERTVHPGCRNEHDRGAERVRPGDAGVRLRLRRSGGRRCARRSTRPPIWAASGSGAAPRWSTRLVSPGVFAALRAGRAPARP